MGSVSHNLGEGESPRPILRKKNGFMAKVADLNPLVPRTEIVLRDGKPRTFKWTYGAKMLFLRHLPERTKAPKGETEAQEYRRLRLSVAFELRYMLFAGLAVSQSADEEVLSLEALDELMPVDDASIQKLSAQVWGVVYAAENGPGEKRASGGAIAKPSRSRGRRS